MMVRFFSSIKTITGTASVEIPHEKTIGDLALSLSALYPKMQFDNDIIILINGTNFYTLGGWETGLKPGDVIDILPVLIGG